MRNPLAFCRHLGGPGCVLFARHCTRQGLCAGESAGKLQGGQGAWGEGEGFTHQYTGVHIA